eukprot:CAMPEP_0179134416 /NCGR_PEP_ID=MMETSP0796-20121207/63960_1 /TAXON_ID=73915 /ORGANISM="Pyrodinium bahamense, Strain pbaha01" /LENGTH=503 /DNA_ID=CAMNT_0020833409 /DNA_START=12 /DNA_END=1521 /DNA_ORIENTATION=+
MGRQAYTSFALEAGELEQPEQHRQRQLRHWRPLAAALLAVVAAVALVATWRRWPAPGQRSGAPRPLLEAEAKEKQPKVWNPDEKGEPLDVKVLTFNTYWWHLYGKDGGEQGIAGHLIADSGPYDFMGFQECDDPWRVLNDGGIRPQYNPVKASHGIAMAYRNNAWKLLGSGEDTVAEDQQGPYYFGQRGAQWMRLQHYATNRTVIFVNHHGPLPLSSGGAWGAWTVAHKILTMIVKHGQPGDAVILVGDFNSHYHSPTIKELRRNLHHVYTGTAFGGIDNIFTNVKGNVVSRTNLGHGGSDHDALQVVIHLGPPAIAPMQAPASVQKLVGRIQRNAQYVVEGNWSSHEDHTTLESCIRLCSEKSKCRTFAWAEHAKEHKSRCWLKEGEPSKAVREVGLISGLVLKKDRGDCKCNCKWAISADTCKIMTGAAAGSSAAASLSAWPRLTYEAWLGVATATRTSALAGIQCSIAGSGALLCAPLLAAMRQPGDTCEARPRRGRPRE